MQQSDYTDWNKQATVCLLMQSPPPRGAQLSLARNLLYIQNYNVKVFVSCSISTIVIGFLKQTLKHIAMVTLTNEVAQNMNWNLELSLTKEVKFQLPQKAARHAGLE